MSLLRQGGVGWGDRCDFRVIPKSKSLFPFCFRDIVGLGGLVGLDNLYLKLLIKSLDNKIKDCSTPTIYLQIYKHIFVHRINDIIAPGLTPHYATLAREGGP